MEKHCEYFDIKKGVRQGCILSPSLFYIHPGQVMREADIENIGMNTGSQNITN